MRKKWWTSSKNLLIRKGLWKSIFSLEYYVNAHNKLYKAIWWDGASRKFVRLRNAKKEWTRVYILYIHNLFLYRYFQCCVRIYRLYNMYINKQTLLLDVLTPLGKFIKKGRNIIFHSFLCAFKYIVFICLRQYCDNNLFRLCIIFLNFVADARI